MKQTKTTTPVSLPFAKVPAIPMVLHARTITATGGGPDKTILSSAAYVDSAQLRLAAAYIHPTGDPGILQIRERAMQAHCPLFEIPESWALDTRTIRSLLSICREHHVTLWHAHDHKTNALGLLLRRFWPMKLVSTLHGWTFDTMRSRFYASLDRLWLRRYDHLITVSPLLTRFCESLGVPSSHITYLPNAIDCRSWVRRHSMLQARRELELPGHPMIITVMGRLSPEKGVDRAVRSMVALRQQIPDLEMHIVGEGPQSHELHRLVAELDLCKHVKFHGYVSDPRMMLEASDLLLLPSHTEGLPNVLLEAMAMGVAVAATDVGGVRELLAQGYCGLILDADQSQWPHALLPLLHNQSFRMQLVQRARSRIESQYSFAGRMAREITIYESLLRLSSEKPILRDLPTLRKAA